MNWKRSIFVVLTFLMFFVVLSESAYSQYSYPETKHVKPDHKKVHHDVTRQHYEPWKWNAEKKYHYRKYNFKPKPDSPKFKYHYVVWLPKKPKHIYFYNPEKKHYWGRCPAKHVAKPQYSLLKPEHRKPKLTDIKESWFPPLGKIPAIPESNDGIPMKLPPGDLPSDLPDL